MTEDIYVYKMDLPEGIHEIIAPCADGYTVWIDKDLPDDKALKVYHHAVQHVQRGDWSVVSQVQTIERETHERDKDCLPVSAI